MNSSRMWTPAFMVAMGIFTGRSTPPALEGIAGESCAVATELRYDETMSRAVRTGPELRSTGEPMRHHATILVRRASPASVSFTYQSRARTDAGPNPPASTLGSVGEYAWNAASCTTGKMLQRRKQSAETVDDEFQFRFDGFLIALPQQKAGKGYVWTDSSERQDSLAEGGTRYLRQIRRMKVTGDTLVNGVAATQVQIVTHDSIERRQSIGPSPVKVVIVSKGGGTALVRRSDNTMLERFQSQEETMYLTSYGAINSATSTALTQKDWRVQLAH